MENNQTISNKVKLDFKDSKYATGRRKKSVAKVWLKKGTGKFYVNGKSLDDYFPRANHKMQILLHIHNPVLTMTYRGQNSFQIYHETTQYVNRFLFRVGLHHRHL